MTPGRLVMATSCTLVFVSCGVAVGACKPKRGGATDAGVDHGKTCAQVVVELGTYQGKDLTYDESTAEFRRLRLRADHGIAECKAAGNNEAVAALEDVKRQIDRQEAAAEEANRAARRSQINSGNVPIDPASCPKGRVMFDSATGKAVHCTGTASAGTSATTDDDDVRSSCTRVKDQWRRSDGIEPIIDCTMADGTHRDVKVVVTNAGWDYLGEHGKRRAFAQSVVDAFRPHWTRIHAWNGSEPAQRQAHLYRMNGVDTELAALVSASGFYEE